MRPPMGGESQEGQERDPALRRGEQEVARAVPPIREQRQLLRVPGHRQEPPVVPPAEEGPPGEGHQRRDERRSTAAAPLDGGEGQHQEQRLLPQQAGQGEPDPRSPGHLPPQPGAIPTPGEERQERRHHRRSEADHPVPGQRRARGEEQGGGGPCALRVAPAPRLPHRPGRHSGGEDREPEADLHRFQAEPHPPRQEQDPERVAEPLDPLPGVEDQPVTLDQVVRVAVADEVVVEGAGAEEARRVGDRQGGRQGDQEAHPHRRSRFSAISLAYFSRT